MDQYCGVPGLSVGSPVVWSRQQGRATTLLRKTELPASKNGLQACSDQFNAAQELGEDPGHFRLSGVHSEVHVVWVSDIIWFGLRFGERETLCAKPHACFRHTLMNVQVGKRRKQRSHRRDHEAAFLSSIAFRCKRNRKMGDIQCLWIGLCTEEQPRTDP